MGEKTNCYECIRSFTNNISIGQSIVKKKKKTAEITSNIFYLVFKTMC